VDDTWHPTWMMTWPLTLTLTFLLWAINWLADFRMTLDLSTNSSAKIKPINILDCAHKNSRSEYIPPKIQCTKLGLIFSPFFINCITTNNTGLHIKSHTCFSKIQYGK
jgi:hypothetical protein